MSALRKVLPGLALAAVLALLGQALAEVIGKLLVGPGRTVVPGVTLAILLGLLLANLLRLPDAITGGARFATTHVLRAGIVLLGLRLSLADAADIATSGLPLIVATITTALLLVGWLGGRLGVPPRLATLLGVGTSICGATAIVATSPAIGARSAETTYAVACIVLCGLSGMLAYPLLAHWLLDGDPVRVGLFLGAAIPDTAQVVGSGMAYQQQFNDPRALEVATVTKMLRNLTMIVVIPLMAIRFARQAPGESGAADQGGLAGTAAAARPRWQQAVPLFVFGFIATSLLRSVGDAGDRPFGVLDPEAWKSLLSGARVLADFLLAMAMAALGLSTRITSLREIGFRPLLLALASMLAIGAVAALVSTL